MAPNAQCLSRGIHWEETVETDTSYSWSYTSGITFHEGFEISAEIPLEFSEKLDIDITLKESTTWGKTGIQFRYVEYRLA